MLNFSKAVRAHTRFLFMFGGCTALAAIVLVAMAQNAHAIRVTMKRVVFEGTQRTADLTIVNNTPDEQVYRLGFKTMRMTASNGLETLKTPDEDPVLKVADSLIRYSPRRVTIPPGGTQQVRLMVNKPKDLPDGEYRSHFWIRPEAESAKFSPNPDSAPVSGPSVQIKMLAGVTLPVFVRVGPMNARAELANGAVKNDGNRIRVDVDIIREGNRSLYGDFDFSCNQTIIHQVRGIAVYTEIGNRHVSFDFPVPKGGLQGCTALDVLYSADAADPIFKGGVMAQTQIAFP